MNAITLWQPWASWIAAGWKTIETRRHRRFACLAGQRIAIHAGMKWDPHWHRIARSWLTDTQVMQTPLFKGHRGVIVCTALVLKHRKLSLRDSNKALCFCGGAPLWGLDLTGVIVHPALPGVRGHQGIWHWLPDVPEKGKRDA